LEHAWDHLHPSGPARLPGGQIDRRRALVRSECNDIDAVIDAGADVMSVALRAGERKRSGDRRTFDRFMETLEIKASSD
jgi:hypothetical protein